SSAAANAAGAALATFPSTVPEDSPDAVTLVADGDWQGGIAAAALMAAPVRAPLLFSGRGGVHPATSEALTAMDPQGSNRTNGEQLFALPGADIPSGYETRVVKGSNPAEVAARLAGLRAKLAEGPPEHVLVTSQRESGIAMPAAAWAARSGDPVLFAGPQGLPKPTARMLAKFKEVPVYVLGPTSAIPTSIENEIADISGQVARISGEEPVANAINFARYSDGSFGWNVNDPGHGFVIARSNRPLDAVAAAPLSGAGTWGPLLLTDNAATLPGTLRSYLLDVKPGYTADPTRAFYNHVWVIGDLEAISVNLQAAIDYTTELGKVEPGGAAR
ncbi:MAG: cell wall-binding repeat-containing protein, partial [Solirubrobacterales bacterium]